VIAIPTQTRDTGERADLPGFRVTAVGVESTFRVAAILKGNKTLTDFVLHHYRLLKPGSIGIDPPFLAAFEPNKKSFLLFLVREPGGRYTPCSGQTDPTLFSVLELQGFAQ
jgi:hypothetical protein